MPVCIVALSHIDISLTNNLCVIETETQIHQVSLTQTFSLLIIKQLTVSMSVNLYGVYTRHCLASLK